MAFQHTLGCWYGLVRIRPGEQFAARAFEHAAQLVAALRSERALRVGPARFPVFGDAVTQEVDLHSVIVPAPGPRQAKAAKAGGRVRVQ